MATIVIVEGHASTFLRDRRMSLASKGLLGLLVELGRSRVSTQFIAKRVPDTKSLITELLNELRTLGYAKRFRKFGTGSVSYHLSYASGTCPRYVRHTQNRTLSEREEVLFSFREQDRDAGYTRETDSEFDDWDSIDPSSAVPSTEQPALIPKLHLHRDRPIIESIPSGHHKTLIRICYLAETDAEGLLINSVQRGRVASVLGQLRDAKVDLNKLHHFERWWMDNWRSRDRVSKVYQPPRPEQVLEHWVVAMKSYEERVKPTVSDAPKNNVVNFDVMEAMQRRAQARKA